MVTFLLGINFLLMIFCIPLYPLSMVFFVFFLIFHFSADKLLPAYSCFEEILQIKGNFLKSYQNLDNVKNRLVERWHFRMLNDEHRNEAFKNAIRTAIKPKAGETSAIRILDIGTGTGLLSVYARQLGAATVIACEDSKVMTEIAKHVFQANNMSDDVQLINKYSCDLSEADIGGRVDVVVTETLDSGVFGEGILQTLIHAKEHLLKPDIGRIIPSKIKLYIAGFESKTIAIENVCTNNSFTDLIYLKGYRLVANNTEPYDTENVRQIKDFKIITKIEEAFSCDFNSLSEMRECLDGTRQKKVRLDYERTGFLDGFVVWFALNLDDANLIESKPSVESCWDQTIFKLNQRFPNMEKLKYLNVTVSCKEGILNLCHYYDFPGKVFSVNQDVIKFINDAEYLNKLEFDFFSGSGRGSAQNKTTNTSSSDATRTTYTNILDFSPFPYIGISLLKEKRAEKLYCSIESQDFIFFVATCNCLKFENIVFINEPIDVLYIPEIFDVIILSPIETLGCVNSSQISNYTILKANKLVANGIMIPHKIEVWGQIVTSEWLSQVSHVTNAELVDLHVTDMINQFSTTNQLNLLCFDHEKLSNPFQMGEISMDDELAEKFILIKMKPTDKSINGILYFYKIYVTAAAEPISTRRIASYIKRACFIIDNFRCSNAKAIVHFMQNHGVIRCKLLS